MLHLSSISSYSTETVSVKQGIILKVDNSDFLGHNKNNHFLLPISWNKSIFEIFQKFKIDCYSKRRISDEHLFRPGSYGFFECISEFNPQSITFFKQGKVF